MNKETVRFIRMRNISRNTKTLENGLGAVTLKPGDELLFTTEGWERFKKTFGIGEIVQLRSGIEITQGEMDPETGREL